MATLTFGSCYFDKDLSVPTENVAGIPVKAEGITIATQLEGFSHSNNRLTNVGVGRTYAVMFTGTMAPINAVTVIAVASIRKNGLAVNIWSGLQVSKAAVHGAVACAGQLFLDTGDYIEVWLTSDTGENLQVNGGALSAHVIG
jgi:hypothetical protein